MEGAVSGEQTATAVELFDRTLMGLRARHMQVLRAAAAGLGEIETAADLHLSVWTVKTYRRGVLNALHAKNMVEAVHNAHLLGILP